MKNILKNLTAIVIICVCVYFIYDSYNQRKTTEVITQTKIEQIEEPIKPPPLQVKERKKPKTLNLTKEEIEGQQFKFTDTVQQCFKQMHESEFEQAEKCLEELDKEFYDFDFYQKEINGIKYHLAFIKKELGKYKEAQDICDEIIYYEKQNASLAVDAKALKGEINALIFNK